jgi:hypothetical protein
MEQRIDELRRQNEETAARIEKFESLRDRYEQEAQKCEAQLSKLVTQYKEMQRLITAQKRLKEYPNEPLQMRRNDSDLMTKPNSTREEPMVFPSTFGIARNDQKIYTSSGDDTSSRLVYEYSQITCNANSNDRKSLVNPRILPQQRRDDSDDEECDFEIDEDEPSNVYLKRFLKRKEMVELRPGKQPVPEARGRRPEAVLQGQEVSVKETKNTVVSAIKHKIESKIHNPNFLKRL